MKVKNLLCLVLVAFFSQFLFSCSTAEYYRFSASNSEYQNKAKVKSGEQAPETPVLVSEEMIASAGVEPVSTEADPVLEANTAAPVPVLFEKEILKKTETPVAAEKKTISEEELTINQAATIAMAKERLATMTKAEKREFKKEMKSALRESRDSDMVVKVILSFLLPPLAVYLHEGELNNRFWISVLLTLLIWVPGIIYALLVVTDSV